MRLIRRLTESIRNHDWFFVVVDILVLVLGLLLAFQVDRWWEERKQRRDEQAYLARLWDETGANLRLAAEREARQSSNIAEMLLVRRAVDDPAERRRLAGTPAGCRMLHLPAARLANTAYEELVESDRLDLIRDAELKTRLRNAVVEHTFTNRQLDYFRGIFLHYHETLGPYIAYSINPEDGTVSCRIRVEALAQDPAAVHTLAQVYRDQTVFSTFRIDERKRLEAVRDRLACLLDKPECRRR